MFDNRNYFSIFYSPQLLVAFGFAVVDSRQTTLLKAKFLLHANREIVKGGNVQL